MTLAAFQKRFGSEEACRAHLEAVRWPQGPVCPACGVVRRAGRLRRNPAFLQCRDCDHQFSVTSGTAMHGTKVPLAK
ncbi:transposase [Roseomonas sp. GCM10028921]